MRATLSIAYFEIKLALVSARFFWIAFLFCMFFGSFFYSYVDSYLSLQANAIAGSSLRPSLGQLIRATFEVSHFILFLLIPAITMNSFSQEENTKSIRLLFKAPISSTSIDGKIHRLNDPFDPASYFLNTILWLSI